MNVGFQAHSLGLTCFMWDTGKILAPVYFIALLPPTPKCGNPMQSSYIDTELSESQMFACMHHF